MQQIPPPSHFTIEPQRYGDTVFLRLSGELDLATEAHFEQVAESLSANARNLVVDLTEVTFIDSSGLRALLRAWERSRSDGHDLVVIPGGEQVRQAMSMTGLESILPLVEEAPDLPVATARS